MQPVFDHEKLIVYQEAVRFVAWADALLAKVPKGLAIHSQLDRAATSIALNIAESNGKYSMPDRCRHMDIARGSAVECAACLDVLLAKGRLADSTARDGKTMLRGIVSMLVGLIRAKAPDRLGEEPGAYEPGASPMTTGSVTHGGEVGKQE